jgi:formamidopyrimidine-DNA glycosylase
MPELPEVETTRLGLLPIVTGKRIVAVTVRDRRLRWPIPGDFERMLNGRAIRDISRRGKYLLWDCRAGRERGYLLTHLGMSGSLRILKTKEPPGRHDHVDLAITGGTIIRYTDPRRFGAMLWIHGAAASHPLIDVLGPEPLEPQFNGEYLFRASRGRSVSVKEFIMNGHVVVGVGNIYASESLFRAGINPRRPAGRISARHYDALAAAIKFTLAAAIRAGGSSLRNYVQADGELGYFQVNAFVYDRAGLPCRRCDTPIKSLRQGQRSTFFCPTCQR